MQIRDPGAICSATAMGPGSAAHRFALRCARDTFIQFQIKTVPGATAVTNGVIKLTAIYTMDP